VQNRPSNTPRPADAGQRPSFRPRGGTSDRPTGLRITRQDAGPPRGGRARLAEEKEERNRKDSRGSDLDFSKMSDVQLKRYLEAQSGSSIPFPSFTECVEKESLLSGLDPLANSLRIAGGRHPASAPAKVVTLAKRLIRGELVQFETDAEQRRVLRFLKACAGRERSGKSDAWRKHLSNTQELLDDQEPAVGKGSRNARQLLSDVLVRGENHLKSPQHNKNRAMSAVWKTTSLNGSFTQSQSARLSTGVARLMPKPSATKPARKQTAS